MLSERLERLDGSVVGSVHNASTRTPKYMGRENRNNNILRSRCDE